MAQQLFLTTIVIVILHPAMCIWWVQAYINLQYHG